MKGMNLVLSGILIIILLTGCVKEEVVEDSSIEEEKINQELEEELELNRIEKVAVEFAEAWENHEYEKMYDLFTPEAKQKKSKEDFIYILTQFEILSHEKTPSLRVDEIKKLNATSVLVFYHKSDYTLFTLEMDSIPLKFINNNWLFDDYKYILNQQCIKRKYFSFSECPLTKDCTLKCGKNYLATGLPRCSTDYETYTCECECNGIKDLNKQCGDIQHLNSISKRDLESREDLFKTTCSSLAKVLQILDLEIEEEGDTVIFKNLEEKELIDIYVLINGDYEITIESIKTDESKVINKKDIKHKLNKDAYLRVSPKSIYVVSEQGRYSGGIDDFPEFEYLAP